MSRHVLKVVPPYFDSLLDGSKTFEVRANDRGFQKGDVLALREWQPTKLGTALYDRFTGREVHVTVTYVFAGDPRFNALQPGFVVLGFAPMQQPSSSIPAPDQTSGTENGNE